MDPNIFDSLTRQFVMQGSRRRVLAGVAASAAMFLARSRLARAAECPAGFTICGPAENCNFGNPATCYCYAPSRGEVCVDPRIGTICHEEDTACTGPDGYIRTCANPYQVCCYGKTCGAEQEFCAGLSNLGVPRCCLKNEIPCQSESGLICINQPTCAADEVFSEPACRCQACQSGQVKCGNHCVLPCAAEYRLNPDTCACDCRGEVCGATCCPEGQVCASEGNGTLPAVCCPAGDVCGGNCRDTRLQCCVPGKNGLSCPKNGYTCCPQGKNGGGDCCEVGQTVCDQGSCVPPAPAPKRKKRKKHHKH